MSERASLFSLADLREEASCGGRAIDGGAAFTPVRDDALLALVEVAEAAKELARHPYGQTYERDFYRLREKLKVFA